MADEKSEKDTQKEPEKGPETGKGDAGDINPEVAELMKDPAGITKVLAALKKANKEAETRRLKADADEKKALEDQGKFKELAEKAKGENETMRSTFTKRSIDQALRLEAQAAGTIDVDAVVALANRAEIKVGDDFEITGAKEAVEMLKTSKAHLFGVTDTKVAPPKSGVPAPRGGFSTKIDGKSSSAHEDLAAGFNAKK
jgi:hypothetical protein